MAEDFNPALKADQTQADTNEKSPEAQQPPADSTPDQTVPSKPKNKAELEAENAELEAENAALVAENRKLSKQLEALSHLIPKQHVAREGHTVVFIKSDRVPAVPRNGKKYLEGSVNGRKFEVVCDVQTEVPDDVAEALAGVIRNQS